MLSFRRHSVSSTKSAARKSADPNNSIDGSDQIPRGVDTLVLQNERPIVEGSLGGQSIQDRIAERAYFRWVEAGQPPGHDIDYWLTAEHEILTEIATLRRGLDSRG